MIVAMHQPNYLPYLGFFDKMNKCDVFVIYDDAQFSTSDFHHRNKIRIFHGWKWLTIPVTKKNLPIKDIEIINERSYKDSNWRDYHFSLIKDNYKKSLFFPKFEMLLSEIYSDKYDKLIDINIKLIDLISSYMEKRPKIVYSSEFGFKSKGTQKIIDIVNALNGDIYLSGSGGYSYLETELFKISSIELQYQQFQHPVYDQCYEGFIPNLSAIDSLLNLGKLPI